MTTIYPMWRMGISPESPINLAGLDIDIIVKTPREIAEALENKDHFIQEIITKGRVLYG